MSVLRKHVAAVGCEGTGHFRVTRDFLLHRHKVFDILMES